MLIKNKTLVQVVSIMNSYYSKAADNVIFKLVSLDNWIPMRRKTGKEMEVNSILGSFFRPSSFPDSVSLYLFSFLKSI